MGCKVRLALRICSGSGGCVSAGGWFHPAGCMRARYPHLDVEVAGGILVELARKRGVRLPCHSVGGAVVLYPEGLRVEVRVEADEARLRCRGSVYVMRTRSGAIYLGPVEAAPPRPLRSRRVGG